MKNSWEPVEIDGKTELEKQIAQRVKEAEEKKISEKASLIAQYLGHGIEDSRHVNFSFDNKNFSIRYERGETGPPHEITGYNSLKIIYKGKQVFKEGGATIYSYIPGDWETELESLYQKALVAYEVKKQEKIEKEEEGRKEKERKIREKWGL